MTCIVGSPHLSGTAKPPIRVIYIVGPARSGSTVLAALLGRHPDALCAGELSYLPEKGWTGIEPCSCGRRGDSCEFWSDVRRRWSGRTGGDVDRLDHLIRRIELSRGAMRRLSNEGSGRWPDFQQYARHTQAIFDSIREAGGRSVIVDSSKRRTRALALMKLPEIDLRVIHLVRDLRGIAWSMQKTARETAAPGDARRGGEAWKTAAGWIRTHLEVERVRRRLDRARYARLRYEDFIADPVAALAPVSSAVGLDLACTAQRLLDGESIALEHVITGNRMRVRGSLRLRPDVQWHTALARRDRWICWGMAGWLLRHYGYEKRPTAAGPAALETRHAA